MEKRNGRLLMNVLIFLNDLDNDFEITREYNGTPVTLAVEKFIKGAEIDVVPDDSGASYLKIVESSGGESHNHFLKDGEDQLIHNLGIYT